MGHVLIERVLLATLEDAGLSRPQVALLVDAARRGSPTAARMLDTAARALVSTKLNTVVATVEIAPGIGWRGGILMDPWTTIPLTLAQATIGQPIGDLISHPDIDPSIPARAPPSSGGTLEVPMERVEVRIPASPLERLRCLRSVIRTRHAEKPIGFPIARAGFLAATSVMIIMKALAASAAQHGGFALAGACVGLVGGIALGLFSIDALLARAPSEWLMENTSHERRARHDHAEWLLDVNEERGFDDNGQPL